MKTSCAVGGRSELSERWRSTAVRVPGGPCPHRRLNGGSVHLCGSGRTAGSMRRALPLRSRVAKASSAFPAGTRGSPPTASARQRSRSRPTCSSRAMAPWPPFATKEALLPGDANNDTDLYEWRNDILHLLTDGVSDFQEGNSAPWVWALDGDGSNILFGLVPPGGSLTGFERDGVLNLYDARIDGGFKPPPGSEACAGDSCQGPLLPAPPASAPRSATNDNGSPPRSPVARAECGVTGVASPLVTTKSTRRTSTRRTPRGEGQVRRRVALLAACALICLRLASSARAAVGPLYNVHATWGPTNLTPGDTKANTAEGQFALQVQNVGDAVGAEDLTIVDKLPAGVTATAVHWPDPLLEKEEHCSGVGSGEVKCVLPAAQVSHAGRAPRAEGERLRQVLPGPLRLPAAHLHRRLGSPKAPATKAPTSPPSPAAALPRRTPTKTRSPSPPPRPPSASSRGASWRITSPKPSPPPPVIARPRTVPSSSGSTSTSPPKAASTTARARRHPLHHLQRPGAHGRGDLAAGDDRQPRGDAQVRSGRLRRNGRA